MTNIIKYLSSIHCALFSFTTLFIIVVIGTFAQTDHGIFYVQQEYFKPWFIWATVGDTRIPVFPGGTLAGTVLVINLMLSTVLHIKWSWQRAGLIVLHVGVIVLLVGGGLSSCISRESQIYLEEGDRTFYSEDLHDVELIVIDALNKHFDYVITIPESRLKTDARIIDEALPFDIAVHAYFKNTLIKHSPDTLPNAMATQGIGKNLSVTKIPVFTQDDQRNNVTALVSFIPKGTSIESVENTYLFALDINGLQQITYNNRPYYVQIRPKRYYFPFFMTLRTFTKEYYPHSSIPKNYSSLVNIEPFNKKSDQERDVLIYMNHPFRDSHFTFYQASFGEERPSSVLQVVYNPSWLIPYISCIIITLGMGIHFMIQLLGFLRKREKNV